MVESIAKPTTVVARDFKFQAVMELLDSCAKEEPGSCAGCPRREKCLKASKKLEELYFRKMTAREHLEITTKLIHMREGNV